MTDMNSCTRTIRRLIPLRGSFSLLLAAVVLIGCCTGAYCEGTTESVIREEELQQILDSYLREKDLLPELISVGYVYTGTGESWYHNGDLPFYSASLYKVPLMMLLAEKEANGELTQESEIYGMPLSYIEEQVLVYSDNPIAYNMLLWFGEASTTRRMFCRFAELPEDYYNWDFYSSSYFTARFMTEVMQDLLEHPESYPHVMDRLKQAQPGRFFKAGLEGDDCEIAQKYGNYHDEMSGADWNHTAGIVFTEHPFVLTVMTRYGGLSEMIISDLAVLFRDYTLQADERLEGRGQIPAEGGSQKALKEEE